LTSAAAFSDHLNDISGAGTSIFSADAVIDTRSALGDRAGDSDVIAMHSKALAVANKADLIDYLRPSEYEPELPYFLGMRVVVDDRLPYTSATDVTEVYIMGAGSVLFGGNAAPVPFETDRDTLTGGGLDVLVSRSVHAIHPRGASLDVSGIAGSTPSNMELSDGTVTYTATRDLKNIPIAALKCTTV